ncbi:MAG: SCO family protein [bacterium]
MSEQKITQRILWTVLAVGLISIGIFSLNQWLRKQELVKPTRTLPALGIVPNFTLTKQDRTTLSLADLKGKIWVADLIFTNCEGTCPMLTQAMANLQQSLIKNKSGVQLVSFSVDPNTDTPEVLSDYAKHFHANLSSWSFLTGSVAGVYTLAKDGFKLTLDSANADTKEPIVHSERLVLIDKQGVIRGYYDGTADDVQTKVLTDIGDLMREEKTAQ